MSRKTKPGIKVKGIAQWLEIKYALAYNMGTFIATAKGNFYQIGEQLIPAEMAEKPYSKILAKNRNIFGEPLDGRQID